MKKVRNFLFFLFFLFILIFSFTYERGYIETSTVRARRGKQIEKYERGGEKGINWKDLSFTCFSFVFRLFLFFFYFCFCFRFTDRSGRFFTSSYRTLTVSNQKFFADSNFAWLLRWRSSVLRTANFAYVELLTERFRPSASDRALSNLTSRFPIAFFLFIYFLFYFYLFSKEKKIKIKK